MTGLGIMSDQQQSLAARLILGTVQFGISYGVTNAHGRVLPEVASDILHTARRSGIRLVDTAADYGASEEILGRCLPPDMGVITKIPAVKADVISGSDVELVKSTVLRSLDLLRRAKVDAVLMHQCADLFKPGGERLVRLLDQLKTDGVTSAIGISVYDSADIDYALELFRPDVVQVPMNLLDQRLKRSGHIVKMRNLGIEVHARSAFLQGVLLAEPSSVPAYFKQFDNQFARYRDYLALNEISPLAACLGFMIEQSGCNYVLVGVTAQNELEEIVSSLTATRVFPSMEALATDEIGLIDPRKWQLFEPNKATH